MRPRTIGALHYAGAAHPTPALYLKTLRRLARILEMTAVTSFQQKYARLSEEVYPKARTEVPHDAEPPQRSTPKTPDTHLLAQRITGATGNPWCDIVK